MTQWVNKVVVLEILSGGRKTCDAVVTAIQRSGVPFKGTEWWSLSKKAWQLLDRLRAQGLVSRSYQTVVVHGKDAIARERAITTWRLTAKGGERLEWFRRRKRR